MNDARMQLMIVLSHGFWRTFPFIKELCWSSIFCMNDYKSCKMDSMHKNAIHRSLERCVLAWIKQILHRDLHKFCPLLFVNDVCGYFKYFKLECSCAEKPVTDRDTAIQNTNKYVRCEISISFWNYKTFSLHLTIY